MKLSVVGASLKAGGFREVDQGPCIDRAAGGLK